jgi:hypothetical protein
LAIAIITLVGALPASGGANLPEPWWDSNWAFCVPLEVDAGAWGRTDAPAEIFINFTGLLAQAGHGRTVIPDSLRLFEASPAGVLTAVPCQYDPFTKDSGTLIFLLGGTTPAGGHRSCRLYFDVVGDFPPAPVPPLVELTDETSDEGMAAYRIKTPVATYFYQKDAGGFSSLLDRDGNDWINFHPFGGSDGIYRGIPNLVHPDNIFHPGHANCTSSIRHAGPLKVTINTVSKNGLWESLWEIYPAHARLTVVRAPAQLYWFLYEGTPGGLLDLTTDFCVRSNGLRTDMNQSWGGDLAPEWVYFEDSKLDRYLYLVHEDDDLEADSFYQMENNMTVFGFGRAVKNSTNKYLAGGPRHFTIGLADGAQFAAAGATIEAAYHPVHVSTGPLAALVDPNQVGQDMTLIGHWTFDEGAGAIAYDASIFANHAVPMGPTWMTEGKLAGGMAFDGKGDYVTIRGCQGVLRAQARTVSAWIKTQTSDYADLVSWGVSEPDARWLMLLTRGSRKEAYGALQVVVGPGYVTGRTRLTDGQWHHVAAVLEAGVDPSTRDIRLYVDGKPDAVSASFDSPLNTAAGPDVTLGVRLTGEQHFFPGAMDDVRIYNRALTATEIQELALALSEP